MLTSILGSLLQSYAPSMATTVEAQVNASAATGIARTASNKANELEGKVHALEHDLGRLMLVTKALLVLCQQSGAFTEAELREVIELIDKQDGKQDGKYTPAKGARKCVKCSRLSNRRAFACMYCGAKMSEATVL